eukprot:142999-Lingulodinium_polyedra.AAC.1
MVSSTGGPRIAIVGPTEVVELFAPRTPQVGVPEQGVFGDGPPGVAGASRPEASGCARSNAWWRAT